MGQIRSWKSNKLSGTQEKPVFPETENYSTAYTTSAHILSLSCARSFQSTYFEKISVRSVLILSSHIRVGLCHKLPSYDWTSKMER